MNGPVVSRRRFLAGVGAGCAVGVVAPALRPELALAATGTAEHTIVVVVLDGGLDGLSAVVPVGDPAYWSLRRATAVGGALPVDGTFALHPVLAPLLPHWQAGRVAAVPAVGRPGASRSHFFESAVLADGRGGGSSDGSGWLARHLLARSGGTPVTLQGVSSGDLPSAELAGHRGSFFVPDVERTSVPLWDRFPSMPAGLATAYGAAGVDVATAADVALDAVRRLAESGAATLAPAVEYGTDPWARQLRQVGQLLRAGVGVEAAVVRFGGWDTHRGQAGALDHGLGRLATALATFLADIGDRVDRTTVVVLSEFGRRAVENGSGGTDHGNGGLALVLGGGLRGGVHGRWPGLGEGALDDGDVAPANDVRSVLAEVVRGRAGNPALDAVFPGFAAEPVGFA